jgi:hypothetical protein
MLYCTHHLFKEVSTMKTKAQVISKLVEVGRNISLGGSPHPFSGVAFNAYAEMLEMKELNKEVYEIYNNLYGQNRVKVLQDRIERLENEVKRARRKDSIEVQISKKVIKKSKKELKELVSAG